MTNFKGRILIFALVGLFVVVPSLGKAQTVADLQAQIQALLQQLQTLQQRLAQLQGDKDAKWCFSFNTNLRFGDGGSQNPNLEGDVRNLQVALEREGFQIDASEKKGGSVFEESTAAAVSGFQEKYRAEILTPNGLSHGTGYAGPSTRAKLNRLYGCGVVPPVQNGWLTIQPSNFSLQVGETVSVKALYQPPMLPCPVTTGLDCLQVMPVQYPVHAIWTSGNPSIASIEGEAIADCFTTGCTSYNVAYIKGNANGVTRIQAEYTAPTGVSIIARTNVTVASGTAATAPHINSISPQSGPVGTQVTLTGTGFTANLTTDCPTRNINVGPPYYACDPVFMGTNTVHFGPATISNVVSSYGGTSLTFEVPEGYSPPCNISSGACYGMYARLMPGTYDVSVSNANGTSNKVSFVVTDSSTHPSITVLSPNGGETWTKGTTQTIKWQDNTPPPTCPAGAQCAPIAPKHYDLKLVFYNPPCTGTICPMYPYFAPYTIVKNVWGPSYNWSVGNYLDVFGTGTGGIAPNGAYTIQVCRSGTSVCDSSDSYFKIVGGMVSTNHSPVINGTPSIPSNIKVSQSVSFDWSATDADGDDLSWSVSWGDGSVMASACGIPNPQNKHGWAFNTSHTWQTAGTYTVRTTVSDCQGGNDEYVFGVTVTSSSTTNFSLQVISPNGGETWTEGTTQTIKWQDNRPMPVCPPGVQCSPPAPISYDLTLIPYNPPCTGTICPMYPYFAPYTIVKNVWGPSYNWSVGNYLDVFGTGTGGIAPNGAYTIQVCRSGTSVCDSSDSYFKIVGGMVSTNHSPVINGTPSIPSNIKVSQSVSFDWSATDADGDDLSWSVSWGDGSVMASACGIPNPQNKHGWAFNTSHTWQTAGTYTVRTTVSDCRGGSDEGSFLIVVSIH